MNESRVTVAWSYEVTVWNEIRRLLERVNRYLGVAQVLYIANEKATAKKKKWKHWSRSTARHRNEGRGEQSSRRRLSSPKNSESIVICWNFAIDSDFLPLSFFFLLIVEEEEEEFISFFSRMMMVTGRCTGPPCWWLIRLALGSTC